MRLLFVLVLLSLSKAAFATVRILTFHYNQPDFVEIQYKTLKKFLKDDFELIVFNDAKTIENEKGIEKACEKYGIKCVRFQQQWHPNHPLNFYLQNRLQEPSTIGIWGWTAATSTEEIASNPSVRHSHVIQYALDHYGYDHDDIVVIMDGDNFLIDSLSIRELLKSYDIIGFNQKHDYQGLGRKAWRLSVPKNEEMPWVVFIAFNPSKLPDPRQLQFHVDVIKGQPHLPNNTIGDTGAAIYKYLQKYPHLKILMYHWQDSSIFREYFTYQQLKDMRLNDNLIQFIKDIYPGNVQFFVFEHFMHFAAVSMEAPYHAQKVHYLHPFIDELLED